MRIGGLEQWCADFIDDKFTATLLVGMQMQDCQAQCDTGRGFVCKFNTARLVDQFFIWKEEPDGATIAGVRGAR